MKLMMRVGKHIKYVQEGLQVVIEELQERLVDHDRSKYNEDELKGYMRFEDMPEGLEYGSPEHKAALDKVMKDNDFWALHLSCNDHHPEHFSDITQMGLFQIIEMVCDWRGAHAGYNNTGEWLESIDVNLNKFNFTKEQEWVIWQVANFLQDNAPLPKIKI